MTKFPLNTRILVDTYNNRDYYIIHCSEKWYVEAYPSGSLDYAKKTIAGFSTLKQAKECVTAWKGWMK